MRRRLSPLLFLLLTVGGGLAIGYATRPGAWYAQLAKPAFTPPDWVFAPAWTGLYVLIAAAGWRTWDRAPKSTAMTLWWAQLGLNFAWSPVFFGAHRVGAGLAIVLAMLTAIVAFIVAVRRLDAVAALLFLPYGAWVAFAALLNGAILRLN